MTSVERYPILGVLWLAPGRVHATPRVTTVTRAASRGGLRERVTNVWDYWYETRACLNSISITCGNPCKK